MSEELMEVEFLDAKTNRSYSTYLSPDDVKRSRVDVAFARSILNDLIAEAQKKEHTEGARNDALFVEVFEVKPDVSDADEQAEAAVGTWSHEQIISLIEAYSQERYKVLKNGKKLGRLWSSVSEEMVKKGYNITGHKCSIKFDALKRRYKKILIQIQTSPDFTTSFRYFEQLDNVFRKQQWSSLEGTKDPLDDDPDNAQDNECDEGPSKRRKTDLLEQLLEERKLRRQSREEYRRRKLALLERLIDSLMNNRMRKERSINPAYNVIL